MVARALGSIAQHDAESRGAWGGPSVSAWGEAMVSPSGEERKKESADWNLLDLDAMWDQDKV